ncbi:MAG: L-seryl-tRNA(Sec) selenium transferase [Bacteroidales bacterium]|nr:L-seryl-tRNA(Sec) selenium transferase [Bacteroidales bacterium]
MKKYQEELKNLPGVDKLLEIEKVQALITNYNTEIVKFAIRDILNIYRNRILEGLPSPGLKTIIQELNTYLIDLSGNKLKRVINATGVIIHTNLGRAPFSKKLIKDTFTILQGYNNLEYNLDKGERGSRHDHLTAKLKYLTGAEDVLVVNNNAAAVMLILRTFAKSKEVIVSRGELIEIGGSFRLPEIMAASDCSMVEVGTTNKTHLKDYENAINNNTSLLFKAHQSNYVIQGFTKETSLNELVLLGKKHKIPLVYDMGSGLLRKTSVQILAKEPDVRETLAKGVDLVSFSGDKLIGGPQAGIIAGKKKYISILKKEPMVRALRVGKTTLAFMQAALIYYLDEKNLKTKNLIFHSLEEPLENIRKRALHFQTLLKKEQISSIMIESEGYCGGGSLPTERVPSFAVKLIPIAGSNKKRANISEKIFYALLQLEEPIVAILKSGEVHFDLLTLPQSEITSITSSISKLYHQIC